METAERKILMEERRNFLRELRRKRQHEGLAEIKSALFKKTLTDDFKPSLEKYIANKTDEIGKELSVYTKREDIIACWENIRKRMRYENLPYSPIVDYSTQEKFQTLSIEQIVSLGVKYIGNCAWIVMFDNLIAIGKINDNPIVPPKNQKEISIDEELIQPVFDFVKSFFDEQDQKTLWVLLNGGVKGGHKLIFKGNSNQFVFVFRLLSIYGKMPDDLVRVNEWICKNFSFMKMVDGKMKIFDFNEGSVKNILERNHQSLPKPKRFEIRGLPYTENKRDE